MSKATETDASPSPAPSPAAAAAAQAQAPSTLVVEEVDDIVFESSEDAQPAATGEGAQDNARAAKQAKTGSGNNDQFTVHKWHVPRPSSMAAVLAPQQSLQQQQPAAVPVQRGGRGRGARRGGSRVPRNVGRPRKQAPSTASDYATVAGFSSRHVGVPPGGSTSMAIRAAAAAASNRPVDVGGGPIASNRPFRQAAAKRVFYGDKSDEEEDEQDAAAAAAAEEEEEQGNAEGDANGQDEDENDGEEDDDDEMDVDGQGRKVASVEVPGIVGNGTGNSREAAIKRQKISYQNQEQPLAVREKYRSQSAQSTFAPVPPTPNMQYMNTNVFSLNNKSPHFPLMPVDVTPFQHRQIDPSFALLPTTTSSPTSLLGPPPSSAALAAAAAAADKITAQTLGQVVECGAYLSQTQEEHLPLLRVLNRIMYPVSSLEPVCRFCDADIVTSSVECSCDPKDVLAHVLNWKGCTEMPWKHHLQVLMPLLSLVDKVPPADMVGCCRMLIAATRSNAAQTARSATSLSADVVKTIQLAGHHVTSACYLLDVSEATPDALKAVRYVLVRFLCDLDHRVFRMLQSSDPIRAIVGQKPSPAGHSKLAKRPTEANVSSSVVPMQAHQPQPVVVNAHSPHHSIFPWPHTVPGQMMSNPMMPGQMMPSQLMPGQLMSGQMMPAQMMPSQLIAPPYGFPFMNYPGSSYMMQPSSMPQTTPTFDPSLFQRALGFQANSPSIKLEVPSVSSILTAISKDQAPRATTTTSVTTPTTTRTTEAPAATEAVTDVATEAVAAAVAEAVTEATTEAAAADDASKAPMNEGLTASAAAASTASQSVPPSYQPPPIKRMPVPAELL